MLESNKCSCLNILFITKNIGNRMISEGSCDAEGWSNDAENSALHHRNKLHFKIYSNKKTSKIFHNITVFTVLLFA